MALKRELQGIDINCDVGEGVGNEASLFEIISSCNIACGGHAGDMESMREVLKLALDRNVKTGAHPSYPDRANFGRISMEMEPQAFMESIDEQLQAFENALSLEGGSLHHIKPHGALYNDLARNQILCGYFLKALAPYKEYAKLYVPYKSVISQEAQKAGWICYTEAFCDRNYNDDHSLVSRKNANAIIQDPEKVLLHLLRMVKDQKILTVNRIMIPIQADTYCLHGDTNNVLEILVYLASELPKYNLCIAK